MTHNQINEINEPKDFKVCWGRERERGRERNESPSMKMGKLSWFRLNQTVCKVCINKRNKQQKTFDVMRFEGSDVVRNDARRIRNHFDELLLR